MAAQKLSTSLSLQPVKVTLFIQNKQTKTKVFVDMSKLNILRWEITLDY